MKYFLSALLLLPLALFAINIEGTYDITGWDPYENQSYSGIAVIKQDKNDVFQITWSFNGGSQYKGTGLVHNNELSAVFSKDLPPNEKHIGLQLYKISDNALDGRWVFINQSLIGTEKLTRRQTR